MSLSISKLSCNYLNNPLGVETANPNLCWELQSQENNQSQTAYHILVASSLENLVSDQGDLWDSGRIESDDSIHISYSGVQLQSRQQCFWKVKAWNQDNLESAWSKSASWEMGLLSQTDWQAKWIAAYKNRRSSNPPAPAPYLRKKITVSSAVQARAYVCGLGYYELFINGRKVGDEKLAPGVSIYDKRVLYQTHDIAPYLVEGENMIAVVLGNGWYNCFTNEVWDFDKASWMAPPKLLFQAYIKDEKGNEQVVISDKDWETAESPIIFDAIRNGESYDARKEIADWAMPNASSGNWQPVSVIPGPGGLLCSQQYTPIRITKTIKPVSLKEVKAGIWVYDFGQNMSGWAQLTIEGAAGTEIKLRYAERIDESGDIDASNISVFIKSGECQTDNYILKGDGTETWQPRFTYHGFQYVQVTGYHETLTLDNLVAKVVHTDFNERGSFECSNELLNKIQQCTKWSSLTNYHGFPTDCPHREKNGWTGDAQLSAEQLLFNFDPMTAYRKWISDFRDVQRPNGEYPAIVPSSGWGFGWGNGPAWDSAAFIIPWSVYVYDGDLTILDEHYDSMKRYIDFLGTVADNHIVNYGLGDWCPPTGGAGAYKCPVKVTDTAYYYVDTKILAKTAKLTGRDDDAKIYSELADNIRDAFRKSFMDPEKSTVEGDSQTSYGCAFFQGMINEDETDRFLNHFVKTIEDADCHIDCGILGTKYTMNALTDLGRADLAYKIASQTDFPSWGHWIEQGATTLWESWDGGSSRNHHMFGDISAWFYKTLAGIIPDPEQPGFKHFYIKPNFINHLAWVKAYHQSMFGKIAVEWERNDEGYCLNLHIPVNTSVTACLPLENNKGLKINNVAMAEFPGLAIIAESENCVTFKIGSGNYKISE